MAISLRHMSMVSLMEAGQPFVHGDPLYEDNIWEIEMLRMELQKKYDNLKKQSNDTYDLLNVNGTMGIEIPRNDNFAVLSHEVFDSLAYSTGIEDAEIPWKEYFHAIYEIVVVDDIDYDVFEIKKHIDALNTCDLIPPPSENPPTQKTRYINGILQEYIRVHKEAYKNVDLAKMMSDFIAKKSEIGRRLVAINNELIPIAAKLNVYNDLVQWSMH